MFPGVISKRLVQTGHVHCNIKCHVGCCVVAQWKSLYHVPHPSKAPLEEAGPAVVGHRYLCCSSLLNRIVCSPQLLALHQPVSSLYLLFVCFLVSFFLFQQCCPWTLLLDFRSSICILALWMFDSDVCYLAQSPGDAAERSAVTDVRCESCIHCMTVFVFTTGSTQGTLQTANIYGPLHIWEYISSWQPWLQRVERGAAPWKPWQLFMSSKHMCQTSPPTLHISHIPQECLLFYQVKSKEWTQSCIVCLTSLVQLFGTLFYKTISSCAILSLPSHQFSVVRLKVLLLPVSIYVFMG